MKKILLVIAIFILSLFQFVLAGDDAWWSLIPEWDAGAASTVWSAPWGVWNAYNASAWSNAWDAFASWVFSWESVFSFFKYLAKTLSQIWLVVWAVMIIYAWYKYASWVFTGDASKWWQDAIKSAILGVLVVIFSYAIMKLLISTFL